MGTQIAHHVAIRNWKEDPNNYEELDCEQAMLPLSKEILEEMLRKQREFEMGESTIEESTEHVCTETLHARICSVEDMIRNDNNGNGMGFVAFGQVLTRAQFVALALKGGSLASAFVTLLHGG